MKRPDLEAAGIRLPEGTKVLATKLPKQPVLAVERLPSGTLLADFVVPMRPVPWKAPSTTRTGHSYKDKRLLAWQATVAACARQAMRGANPYPHPVRIDFTFYLSRAKNGSIPDLSNLNKGCEDSLQGIVFTNDRQVAVIASDRVLGDRDAAQIRVHAYGLREIE